MKNFRINICLSDGDGIDCSVVADNQEHALERLQNTEQFKSFLGNREISRIKIKPEQDAPLRKSDYLLQKSEQQANHYVVTDVKNGVVITFEQHLFNETQKVTFLEDIKLPEIEVATILRKVGEWLSRYHYFVAMPIEKQHRVIIGNKIRRIREEAGLTQQELSELCGIDRAHIAKIENGRFNFTIDTLFSISNALGKDIELI